MVDDARYRQKKREVTSSVELAKRQQLPYLVDEPKESCSSTRRTETCVAPRHVDASPGALLAIRSFWSLYRTRLALDFVLFFVLLTVPATWKGGGVKLADFIFFRYFPVEYHERDWTPRKEGPKEKEG